MRLLHLAWIGPLTCAALASTASAAEPDSRGIEFFEKKIRPVLAEKCYRCHSEDALKAKKLKGGLLLDSKAGLLKGGDSGPALVPGKAKDSLLLKALHQDGELKMPPSGKLSDEVLVDFAAWVSMGAPDPRDGKVILAKKEINVEEGRKFWSFQPLKVVPPPAVKQPAWTRTIIDRFILARLEEKGLTPNAAVSREKLIRRAYYDLWGLPPSPAEIETFVKDTAPDAYEKLLDRLLDGPHYGERWARHWLDVVRFAESGGYEFDKDRPGAYHYRDFVIGALNQDMPFDEFVRLQLAGDHLRPGDFQATAATGFLVAGPYPGQSTSKTAQLIRYNHLDDMLSTLGTSMLGLSIGCARCHDHKYDPVPQQDYYRLLANLARTDSADVKVIPVSEVYRKAKEEFDRAHAVVVAERDRFEKAELPGRLQAWQETNKNRSAPHWWLLGPVEARGKLPLKKLDDGSVLAEAKAERGETYTFVAHTNLKGITALRLEGLTDPTLPKSGPGRGPDGGFRLTDVSVTAAPLGDPKKVKPTPIKLKAVQATSEAKGHLLTAALDGKKTGWSSAEAGKGQAAVFELDKAIGFDGGTLLTVTLKFEGDFALGRPRLAVTTAARPHRLDGTAEAQSVHELLAALQAEQGKLTPKNRERVLRWFRRIDPPTNQPYAAVEQHALKEPQPNSVAVFAATSGKGGDVYFLVRGEVERKKELVRPGFVQVLMNTPQGTQHWLDNPAGPKSATEPRLGLANWITDVDHGAGHLLARVIVNRLWQHHLGRGLVGTPNDFGAQGEAPTHPELLDYLASELIKGGWKLKPIHRLIMSSSVYMQGGEVNQAALQADPLNHLWWRHPARRLEAEVIRDALLAVSGTLDATMYGPGTLDENSLRRSVYLKVKRSQLIPLMQMFDAPEAIQSIGARQTTTVATQSLALMNSPFVRQRAEKFALRVRPKTAEGLAQAVEQGYLTALGRRPSDAERERMLAFIRSQAESYGSNGTDRALADFCQVLLCLNEFVYID